VLPRDVFDHCPLVLRGGRWDWGPKPFRFNNFWLSNSNFKGVVEEWRRDGVNGWMSFVLKTNLKNLKLRLREWNRAEYSGMEERVERLVDDIKELDEKGEEVGLEKEEITRKKSKFSDLWKILRARDASTVQQSRARWMKDGDANSKYFHSCIKRRSSLNLMKALKVGDGWAVSPFDVRKAVVDYFTNHFSSPLCDRPTLDGVPFPSLSEDENMCLIAPFSLLEIETVVKDSDGDKSLGPDGYNFTFIKEFWYLIKDDVRIMFDQFHANGILPRGMLAFFVTLILKVSSPVEIKDYRPISLLGCLYKLLAKVLARRMARVMTSIISSNQSGFLKGRNLVDGVMVINELVDYAKKNKKTMFDS